MFCETTADNVYRAGADDAMAARGCNVYTAQPGGGAENGRVQG